MSITRRASNPLARSVQWKIGAVLFASVLVVAVFLTLNGTSATGNALREGARTEVEALATRDALHLATEMALPSVDAGTLQALPAVRGILRAEDNDGVDPKDGSTIKELQYRYEETLHLLVNDRSHYRSITLALADGTELARVERTDGSVHETPLDELGNLGDNASFQETMRMTPGEVFISDVEFVHGAPEIYVGVAIPGLATGQVGAALLIEKDLESILASVQSHSDSDFVELLLDDHGHYLSHPDETKIGTDIAVDYGAAATKMADPHGGAFFADGLVIAHEPVPLTLAENGRYWSIVRITPESVALATVSDFRNQSIMIAAAILLVVVAVGVWVAKRVVSKPLHSNVEQLQAVSAGDLSVLFEVSSEDEVGQMSTALNEALESIGETLASVDRCGDDLTVAADSLTDLSRRMAGAASTTSDQATEVSAASEQISTSSETVSASMDQMSAAVREISASTAEAARMTAEAVSVSATTQERMEKLDQSAADIGEVMSVITSIAAQTDLLALNATIEAARVGEAGKGFAVVANEVKALAQQTSDATEQIQTQIDAIQGDTRDAVTAITEINQLIDEVNGISTTIAGAVEEQSATAAEVTRSIQAVSDGTTSISASITNVASTAGETRGGAADAQEAARNLKDIADRLNDLLAQFTLSDKQRNAGAGDSRHDANPSDAATEAALTATLDELAHPVDERDADALPAGWR